MEITARPRRRGWVRALKAALGVAIAASVALLVPPALGYSTHVVGDDAMGGGFSRGALVLDERLTRGQLSVGDVVTLTPPGGGDRVVRRVLSIDEDGVRTGGDATGADPWVVPESATARVDHVVPGVGWPLQAVHSLTVPAWAPAGLALGLAAALLGLRRASRAGHRLGPPALPASPEGVTATRRIPPAA